MKEHIEHHKHISEKIHKADSKRGKIALVGNPNVGKSIIFNYLSGLYMEVSNYPGTTVEVVKGQFNDYEVYDTPGVYGISSLSVEESIARDIVLEADVVINVVDSVHLERDLFLTQQLIDMGKKVSIILNFQDELEKHGIKIDTEKLSSLLGVPVYLTSAVNKRGLEQLESAIKNASPGNIDPELHSRLHVMLSEVGSQAEALLILEGDEELARKHGVKAGTDRESIYIQRRNRINEIITEVVTEREIKRRISTFIGKLAMNLWTGVPLVIVVLYLVYSFVGQFIAGGVVDYLVQNVGKDLWEMWIRGLVSQFISQDSWLGIILVGDFGVLTMTVTYLLFLLLPLVIAFYLSLSLLEDSGYLPRLAVLMDRSFNAVGLNGSAVIPIVLGFGCVTAATITTRILGTSRERTIATAILQFAIPCSAQTGVVAALIAGAGFESLLIYITTIFAVLVIIGTALNKILPGESSTLLLDLPPMRLPKLDNIVRKTTFRSYAFMKEATPWFFVGALGIGIFQVTGILNVWIDLLTPLVTGWLKLPAEASTAFVMGLVRRDFGAAGLYQLKLVPNQIVVALVTITLFVPCIASFMIMIKERGLKQAFVIWIGTWIIAFLVGGILSHILN